MLSTICKEIHNFFTQDADKHVGDYTIVGGVVSPPIFIQENQYYRVIGSVFNDGVYKHGTESLVDEPEFHGAIWLMRPPKDFLDLVKRIEDWQTLYGASDSDAMSPFNSESQSWDGYSKSYSKSSASGSGVSGGVTWQNMFFNELNQYRRLQT